MRTSETRWAGAVLLLVLSVTGCSREYVLPAELARLGSLESATYVTRQVYPAREVTLQVMRPRLGDPALLHEESQPFELVFYTQHPSDASALAFTLSDELSGDEQPLTLEEPASCDASGLCRAMALPPAGIPTERLLTICVEDAVGEHCQPGAVYRYPAVPEALRLAVIADPQLGYGEGEPTVGERLGRVYDAIAAREPPVHLALVVGDLTQDGTPDMVERFLDFARAFPLPQLIIPGNHDFKDGHIDEYLLRVLPHLDHVNRLGPYLLVGMNSGPQLREQGGRWPTGGVSYGLEAAQIDWLATQVAPEDQVELVYLHHPPYALFSSVIGSHRQEFLDVCQAGDVGVILAGHTHMSEVYDRAGIATGLDPYCDTLPSSGTSRRPISLITARSTERGAGYREVVLHTTGEIHHCWIDVAVD